MIQYMMEIQQAHANLLLVIPILNLRDFYLILSQRWDIKKVLKFVGRQTVVFAIYRLPLNASKNKFSNLAIVSYYRRQSSPLPMIPVVLFYCSFPFFLAWRKTGSLVLILLGRNPD
jgi:hypothetical protein